MFKIRFLCILIIIISSSRAAQMEPRLVEVNDLKRVQFGRTFNIDQSKHIYFKEKIDCRESLIRLRNTFMQKVVVWEGIYGRRMAKPDLVKPYLMEGNKFRLPRLTRDLVGKLNPINLTEEEKIKWGNLRKVGVEWNNVLFFFAAHRERTHYDILFAYQIHLESSMIGPYAGGDIVLGAEPLPLTPVPSIAREEWDQLEQAAFFPSSRNDVIEPFRSIVLYGLIADPPEVKEKLSSKVSRWVRGEPAPLPPPLPPLPVSPPDQYWKYLHEVEGKGFSVFLHIFPDFRDDIADYDAYGMTAGPKMFDPYMAPPYPVVPIPAKDGAAQVTSTGGTSDLGERAGAAGGAGGASAPVAGRVEDTEREPHEEEVSREVDSLLRQEGLRRRV